MICSRSGRAVSIWKYSLEPDVGNEFAAHVGDVFAVRVLYVLPGQFDAFEAVGQRQDEMGCAHAHQQPVDDRQRQRKASVTVMPAPGLLLDFDGTRAAPPRFAGLRPCPRPARTLR